MFSDAQGYLPLALLPHVESFVKSARDESSMGCNNSRVLVLRPVLHSLGVVEVAAGEECWWEQTQCNILTNPAMWAVAIFAYFPLSYVIKQNFQAFEIDAG